MKRIATAVVASLLANGIAVAGSDFGTREEAEELADAMIEILDTEGPSKAVSALFDPELPFASTRLGVNLFEGSIIIGDNREPEMVAADYSETEDLTGVPVWDRIDAAANRGDDVVLKWYHYDTQAVYDFHCYSKHSKEQKHTVMVCR